MSRVYALGGTTQKAISTNQMKPPNVHRITETLDTKIKSITAIKNLR